MPRTRLLLIFACLLGLLFPASGAVRKSITETGWSVRIDGVMRGTLAGAGIHGTAAVAEKAVHLLVPTATEQLHYDGVDRLEDDGSWRYTWDGFNRLLVQERRAGTAMPEPTQTGEKYEFLYDGEGRRIQIVRTITYTEESQLNPRVEERKILWAGWLPLMEEILVYGGETLPSTALARRWFQWGPDLSGTLDAAGGIGGLMAIHEEDYEGGWLRTLLPVQDGLGNIVAVLDAADGRVVAEYAFDPYGETLGETGEPDACPFRWQTKWYLPGSGQYYFDERHYDPKFARWLTPDPLREAGGFNLYAYCGNDPVNKHDPLGLRVPRTEDEALQTLENYYRLSIEAQSAAIASLRTAISDPATSRKWERQVGIYSALASHTYREFSIFLSVSETAKRDSKNRLILPDYWLPGGNEEMGGGEHEALMTPLWDVNGPPLTATEKQYLEGGVFDDNDNFLYPAATNYGMHDNSDDLFALAGAPSAARGVGELLVAAGKLGVRQIAKLSVYQARALALRNAAKGGVSLADDLAAAASRARNTVGPGSGGAYGTRVHSAFEAEVNGLGRGLQTEVSYLNGQVVPRGTPGSVRLDVVNGPLNAPTSIFDLKTGSATLTPGRIQQIQSHVPGGSGVPVFEVRP